MWRGLICISLLLPQDAKPAIVWCTHSTVKIFKDTPAGDAKEVRLELARNEWESAQIVLRPAGPLRGVTFELPKVEGLELSLRRVEYVPVREKTDARGATGEWPDPLPPIEGPLDLDGGRNHVFWLTVHASERATDRAFEIAIPGVAKIPVRVTVWKFSLPNRLRTRTAYGCHIDDRWHALKDRHREVHDLYMQAFRDYRISPYAPFAYHDVVEKDGAFDFTDFDRAGKRYLDEFGFSSFVFPFPLEIDGQKAFSTEYREALKKHYGPRVEHLKKMGWLDRAIAYWIDEPAPDRREYVKEGMAAVAECLPGVKRILTVYQHQLPAVWFVGSVDVWVPIMNMAGRKLIPERQAKGEEVWWYVCTGPKGKYPNNFIDRPALHPRIRYWMMSARGIQGDLYWSTTYWQNKNPWEDAMSYTPDKKGKWGNGDGYLFYPPTRAPATEPVIKPPIPSIRLALIRDGLEDLEYLHLLRDRGATQLLDEAHALVPSLTDFEQDPAKLLALRRRIGEFLSETRTIDAPPPGRMYAGVFPGGKTGEEDDLTAEDLASWEKTVGRPAAWVYFSHNWFRGRAFPHKTCDWIRKSGAVPFIRLMLRSSAEQNRAEKTFSLDAILDGKFDADLKAWAAAAKEFGGPLLVEWGTECNGEWFSWNGRWNGGGRLDGFGDPKKPDGPERFVAVFRRIVKLMREAGAANITWVFHVNWNDNPEAAWNRLEAYYPGDDVVDWIGVSAYGPQKPGDDEARGLRDMLDPVLKRADRIAPSKPVALVEFGCAAGSKAAKPDAWAAAALDDLLGGRWPKLVGFSWWNEHWQNDDDPKHDTTMRVQDIPELAKVFRERLAAAKDKVVDRPVLKKR